MTRGQLDDILEALTPNDGQGFFIEVELANGSKYLGATCAECRVNRGSLLKLELDDEDRVHNFELAAEAQDVAIFKYIVVDAIVSIRGPL